MLLEAIETQSGIVKIIRVFIRLFYVILCKSTAGLKTVKLE